MIGKRLMLSGAWMEAVSGYPVTAEAGFATDRGDIGKSEQTRVGFRTGDVIEGIDSRK